MSVDLKNRNYLSCSDLNFEEINFIFNLASSIKNNTFNQSFRKTLGLIFEKSSTRTRCSLNAAIFKLGGNCIDLNPKNTQIGRGEPIKDTARVLSRYIDVLAIRTFEQRTLEEYVKWSQIPIINSLSDEEHPCQALSDFFTIWEIFGKLSGINLAYVGDSNNVANSLILCASILGVNISIASPKNFEPADSIVFKAKMINENNNLKITNNPIEAVESANVIYTDVWTSMGQEEDKEMKDELFKTFCVDQDLISNCKNDPIILHCLPAYRGKEISDDILEKNQEIIFKQAENRMHIQQALLAAIL